MIQAKSYQNLPALVAHKSVVDVIVSDTIKSLGLSLIDIDLTDILTPSEIKQLSLDYVAQIFEGIEKDLEKQMIERKNRILGQIK